MNWSDDPVRDYSRWETEQYLKELKRPVCCDCGEHIMDEYMWEFHGQFYCERCVEDHKEAIED